MMNSSLWGNLFHKGDNWQQQCARLWAATALIVAGQIEIRSGEVVLAKLASGDYFGEIALVLDVPRTADAVTMEET